MTHLAFNTVLPQSMRVKYQLVIGALPIGLMFLSFAPLFYIATWLETVAGIPHDSAIKNHPNGAIWITAFLVVMTALMVLGYALGWVLNAAIARYVLGWEREQVTAVFGRSEVPKHWLKPSAIGSPESDATSVSLGKWEEQRRVGAFRYILKRGVGAWGGPMFLGMYVVPTLYKSRGFTFSGMLLNTVLWVLAGAVFGLIIWLGSEAYYRKLKGRQ